jgi:hypothetical protein
MPPLAAGLEHVKHALQNLAHIDLASPPAAHRGRDVRFDQRPLRIAQIARVYGVGAARTSRLLADDRAATSLRPLCGPQPLRHGLYDRAGPILLKNAVLQEA